MNIGIIGTGNMGSILVEAIMDSHAVPPTAMMITNRTLSKAQRLKDLYPGIQIGKNADEVAANSQLLFICVKPLDVIGILQQIQPHLTAEKCLISITSPISTDQLERYVACSVIRAIPSITNRALAGVSLITYGVNCQNSWKKETDLLFKKISIPVEIDEKITRVASDIVSCGPAFFSYLLQRFIIGAVNETGINKNIATKLASEMIIGFGELLKQGHYTLPTLLEKVCVKGGITGEGIDVLERELGDIFEHVFEATNQKFAEDLEKTRQQFS
ncbi:late competence protein ComER [Neobacillus sp. SM06]|uniref:late competence protein ComER n=1 Tax=Neobacillus sp. SM06 TaxID=3422492 RepID=UPI003D27E5E9